MKEIIDKLDFIKTENLCHETQCQENQKPQTVRKFLQKIHLLSKMDKELLKLNNKKTTQLK